MRRNRGRIGITMMSFIDQDGMEVGARVRANLRRDIAITIGTCDSNTSSITGPINIACFMPPHTTQINESYWWEILIERSDPRVNVEFLVVGVKGTTSLEPSPSTDWNSSRSLTSRSRSSRRSPTRR